MLNRSCACGNPVGISRGQVQPTGNIAKPGEETCKKRDEHKYEETINNQVMVEISRDTFNQTKSHPWTVEIHDVGYE